jgi:methyl-accepting chemotaxis protein
MDQVTQQNAAMVEQATAAAHSLREETDGLLALIAQFRVGELDPVASKAAPRSPPGKPNFVHAAQQKIASFAGGGRGRGAAAVAVLAPSAPADWEEF